MQIVAHDDNRLVLHQGPWGFRAIGFLFAALGGLLLWYMTQGHIREHNAWVGVVVGGMFAAVGIAMMVFAGDFLCTFDKTAQTVTVRHRRLIRPGVESYRWSDIEDAALEKTMMQSSQGSRSQPGYRPVFVMKNGTRTPWTSVYTSELKRQANCVAAVRAFTGWHTMEGSSHVADAAAVQRAAAGLRMVRRLLFPFLGIFVAVGTYLYAQQVRRYVTWRPVRARVIKTDLVSVPGDKGGSTYKPVVRYAYDRSGETILATGATILSMSSSYNWAEGIRNRYRVGDSVTAYINPTSPSEGFLLRQLSWFPLGFVVMPLLMGVLLSTVTKNAQQGLSLVAADHVPVIDA